MKCANRKRTERTTLLGQLITMLLQTKREQELLFGSPQEKKSSSLARDALANEPAHTPSPLEGP